MRALLVLMVLLFGLGVFFFVVNQKSLDLKFNHPKSFFQSLLEISTLVDTAEEKAMAPQYSCLENPMDGGAWWAAVHGVAEGRTRLSYFTFTFHFHALEKEMATHSSVLAWRIPGTGEPGGLPSMGSHRVGDLAAAAADTADASELEIKKSIPEEAVSWDA